VPTCSLCDLEREVVESHILPRFVYRPAMNEIGQLHGWNARGNLGRAVIQDGIKERLMCNECEDFLNTNYEQPFNEYWRHGELV